jgi:hypothetical protein
VTYCNIWQIWCGISTGWDWLRIGLFYGPVWITVLITFSIYIRAGQCVYVQLKQTRGLRAITNPGELEFDSRTSVDTGRHIMGRVLSLEDRLSRVYESRIRRQQILEEEISIQPVSHDYLQSHRRRGVSYSRLAERAYSKYALLFFVALVVTWVHLLHPGKCSSR